jgi:hypothetical protein
LWKRQQVTALTDDRQDKTYRPAEPAVDSSHCRYLHWELLRNFPLSKRYPDSCCRKYTQRSIKCQTKQLSLMWRVSLLSASLYRLGETFLSALQGIS